MGRKAGIDAPKEPLMNAAAPDFPLLPFFYFFQNGNNV